MKSNKVFDFMKKNFPLLKRLGITFVIPLFLGTVGVLIFLGAGWNLVSESYLVGATIFAQPNTDIGTVKFTINNQKVYRPDLGQQFATINIPDVSLNKPIIHGDTPSDLKKGLGHYAGSTLPGEGGNFVISGHRDTACKNLEDIKVGHYIFVETIWGTYEYKVSEINIVDKDDHYVLDPTNYEKLTMYTCYPFNYIGSAPNRFVVTGEFVGLVE